MQSLMTEEVVMGVGNLAIGVRPSQWAGQSSLSRVGVVHSHVIPWRSTLGDSISLSELSDRSWALYKPSNGLSDYVAAACMHASFPPREAVSTSQVQADVHLALAEVGPVLVSSDNVPSEFAHAARPLNPPIAWELTAFTRTALSPLAAAFVELLHDSPMAGQHDCVGRHDPEADDQPLCRRLAYAFSMWPWPKCWCNWTMSWSNNWTRSLKTTEPTALSCSGAAPGP